MKKGKLNAAIAVFIIFTILTQAAAYAFGRDVYTNTLQLADNLEYVNTVSYSDAVGRGESFALRLTGPGSAYPIVTKSDTIYGTTTISKIVKYAEDMGMNVLAAVNSDFFSMQTGVPMGIVIEDGVYKSSPSGRTAVCFDGKGNVSFIEQPSIRISLRIADPEIAGSDEEPGESAGAGAQGSAPGSRDEPGDGAPGDGAPGDGAPGDAASFGGTEAGSGGETGETPGNSGEPEKKAGGEASGGADDPVAEKIVNLVNFNKFRVDTGGMYLFSEDFSTVSTRTSTQGWFVIFKIIEGTPSVTGTMELQVTDKLISDGAIKIEEGHMILTASVKGGYGEEFDKFEVGDYVTLKTTCYNESLNNALYATGGGDVLISGGEITDPAKWERELQQRAPRTAFGVREDGAVISYVIDGRNSQHSVGMTLSELADELYTQGCVFAVNFDGGGSSALSVRLPGEKNSIVINKPSDGSERGCATYILFVTDANSDGLVKNLSIKNDGPVVLAGSSVDLSYAATDSGYMPVKAPGDIIATSAKGDAVINGSRYTAGKSGGIDTLELFSPSTEGKGKGSIFVITQPTSITVTRKGSGSQMTSVILQPGETLELSVMATYYRKAVTAQLLSFTYTVSGDIGEMTSPGVFKAGALMNQKGILNVSAGGRSVDIIVQIGGFTDMADHWAGAYASYLAFAGIAKGISQTEYGPERIMKRCDFVLMLFRAAGMPVLESSADSITADSASSVNAQFDDVLPEAYYADAVIWARRAGITDGTGGNKFNPDSPLTREQAFSFVYRALKLLDVPYVVGSAEDIEVFPDAHAVAEYAVIPTATLIQLGVVEGSEGMLLPGNSLTRAQMAKVLTVTLLLKSEDADDNGGAADETDEISDFDAGVRVGLATGGGTGNKGLG